MRVLLHDGSFDGLLTALDIALRDDHASADIVPATARTPDLFAEEKPVKTDEARAAAIWERIEKSISHSAARRVLWIYNSELPDLGRALLEYLSLGFRYGAGVDGFHTNRAIRLILDISGKVAAESHRLKGLLRFRRLASGPFWAPIEPDFNVALSISFHFRRRLSSETWGIHDLRRGLVAFWDRRDIELISGAELDRLFERIHPEVLAPEEQDYQELWRAFFRSIGITDRRNPRLQSQNMPRRYWRYLIEKDSAFDKFT